MEDDNLALTYKSSAPSQPPPPAVQKTRRRAGAAKRGGDISQLEAVMANLQQQIDYLQIENKVLKQGSTSQPPASPAHYSSTGPLETMLAALRHKYSLMDEEHSKRIQVGDRVITVSVE